MLPSILKSPATCSYTNGDALATRCRKAKTLIRRPASADFFDAILCVHDTADVLLLKGSTYL